MKESILNKKSILAVDGNSNILSFLEEKIDRVCSVYTFDKATAFEEARDWLESYTYDLLILGMVDFCAFRILQQAFHKSIPAVMITDPIPPQEVLDRFIKMGARACLPKGKLAEIIPFLENVLTYECLPRWRCLLNKSKGIFHIRLELATVKLFHRETIGGKV